MPRRAKPHTARPLDNTERTKVVAVRLTPDELAKWQAAADKDGRTLGGWLRRVVEEHLF